MIVNGEYGRIHLRLENQADDKLAEAIGSGLRQWADSMNYSDESPTKNEPPDSSSSGARQSQ